MRVLLLDRDVDGAQPELAQQLVLRQMLEVEVDPGVLPHQQIEGGWDQVRGDTGITPHLDAARHFVAGERNGGLGLLDGIEHPAGVVHQHLASGGEGHAATPPLQ